MIVLARTLSYANAHTRTHMHTHGPLCPSSQHWASACVQCIHKCRLSCLPAFRVRLGDGSTLLPDGSIVAPDGSQRSADGISKPPGSRVPHYRMPGFSGWKLPEGSSRQQNGTYKLPNGVGIGIDGLAKLPDESLHLRDGNVQYPDGSYAPLGDDYSARLTSGDVVLADGSIRRLDGITILPDGAMTLPDGSIKLVDGTIKPKGTRCGVVQCGVVWRSVELLVWCCSEVVVLARAKPAPYPSLLPAPPTAAPSVSAPPVKAHPPPTYTLPHNHTQPGGTPSQIAIKRAPPPFTNQMRTTPWA